MFDWLGDLLGNAFGSLGQQISSAIFDVMMKWIYEQIYNAVADFFTQMGNMGAEIFDLGVVQSTISLFTLFGWALFAAGTVVAVFDVAVDLRENSPTYGKWVGELLSAENKKQLMIPRGFAHGFLVVSETAEFAYKCDDFYRPEDEGGIMYDSAGIDWPEIDGELILSEKDLKHPTLENLNFKFKES